VIVNLPAVRRRKHTGKKGFSSLHLIIEGGGKGRRMYSVIWFPAGDARIRGSKRNGSRSSEGEKKKKKNSSHTFLVRFIGSLGGRESRTAANSLNQFSFSREVEKKRKRSLSSAGVKRRRM